MNVRKAGGYLTWVFQLSAGLVGLVCTMAYAQPPVDNAPQAKEIPWEQRSWEDRVFRSTHDENYTFNNRGTYVLDPYVWVYNTEFAERFRMPKEWIGPELKGALAVAWRGV